MINVVKTQRVYKCTIPNCGKKFQSEWRYMEHKYSHTVVRAVTCGTCYKAFVATSDLRSHMTKGCARPRVLRAR